MQNLALSFFTLCFLHTQGLPQYNNQNRFTNNLVSNSTVGSFGHAESNATSHGAGSVVGISGVVTGDSATSMGVSSYPSSSGPTSHITSQANCFDFSTSNATGGLGAEASSSGGCLTNVDNTGNHQVSNRVEMGMETQVGQTQASMTGQTNLGVSESLQTNIHEAQIAQGSSQNTTAGSADAYHYVNGPEAVVQFSGILANAQTSADSALTGTSETVMTHNMGNGNTVVDSVFVPYEISVGSASTASPSNAIVVDSDISKKP